MKKKHLSQRLSFTGLVFMLGLVISPEVLADNSLNLNSNQFETHSLIQIESISIPIALEEPRFIQEIPVDIPVIIPGIRGIHPSFNESFVKQPTEYQPISQPISLDVYYEPINYSESEKYLEVELIEPYNPNSLIMMESALISNSSCSIFDDFPFPTRVGSGIGSKLLMITYKLKKVNCDYERSMNELRK